MNNNYFRKIYSDNIINKLQAKIDMLENPRYNAVEVMNIRIVSMVLIFMFVIYINKYGYMFAPFVALGYYYFFEYIFIDIKLDSRAKMLEHEALYFFEILTLT